MDVLEAVEGEVEPAEQRGVQAQPTQGGGQLPQPPQLVVIEAQGRGGRPGGDRAGAGLSLQEIWGETGGVPRGGSHGESGVPVGNCRFCGGVPWEEWGRVCGGVLWGGLMGGVGAHQWEWGAKGGGPT